MSQINTSTSGVNFDPTSAQRIANVVRDYERTEGLTLPLATNGNPIKSLFWVQLGGEDSTEPGNYNWIKQDIKNGTFQSSSPAISDSSNYSAEEANQISGLTGLYVQLQFAGYDSDNTPLFLFSCPSAVAVVVGSSTGAGGQYSGHFQTGMATNFNGDGKSSGPACIIKNGNEAGLTDTPPMIQSSIQAVGVVWGIDSATNLPIVLINALTAVQCSSDSGD
jgi:hypothetical protein